MSAKGYKSSLVVFLISMVVILYALALLLLLNACSEVTIRDNEVCADAGAQGCLCFHTLSDASRDLNRAQCDAEEFGKVFMSTDSFTNLKTAIDVLCQNHQEQCTYEQKKALEKFYSKILLAKKRTHKK